MLNNLVPILIALALGFIAGMLFSPNPRNIVVVQPQDASSSTLTGCLILVLVLIMAIMFLVASNLLGWIILIVTRWIVPIGIAAALVTIGLIIINRQRPRS